MAVRNESWRWRRYIAAIAAGVLAPFAAEAPAVADGIRDQQWHLSFFKLDEVHKITRGEGVVVAVVDTGVDGNHPDLRGNVLRGMDLTSDDVGNAWNDSDGHGTAMASLIAGHGHGSGGKDGVLGLAPAAKVLPIKVTGQSSPGRDVAAGIRMAASQGIKIINVSVGAMPRPDVEDAVKFALDRGAIVVAGAGNTAQGFTDVAAPARYKGVIAVTGTDQSGSFSSASASGPESVLAAPAEDITAAGSGSRGHYASATGTSDATALVSAAAALVWSKYPDLDAKNVINRLIQTADDKGPKGRDKEYGFGVVNPLKALTEDVPKIDYDPLDPSTNPSKPVAAPSKSSNDSASSGLPGYLIPIFAIVGAIFVLSAVTLIVVITRRSRQRKLTQMRHYGPNVPGSPPFC